MAGGGGLWKRFGWNKKRRNNTRLRYDWHGQVSPMQRIGSASPLLFPALDCQGGAIGAMLAAAGILCDGFSVGKVNSLAGSAVKPPRTHFSSLKLTLGGRCRRRKPRGASRLFYFFSLSVPNLATELTCREISCSTFEHLQVKKLHL